MFIILKTCKTLQFSWLAKRRANCKWINFPANDDHDCLNEGEIVEDCVSYATGHYIHRIRSTSGNYC